MLGITDEFYNKVYRNIIGKVIRTFMSFCSSVPYFTFLNLQPAFGLVPVLMRPRSRGRISLKSTNPFRWPRMEPNFYSDRKDLLTLIEGIRMVGHTMKLFLFFLSNVSEFFQCLLVAETKGFKELGARLHTTPFPGCETHRFHSDEYWECCIRKYASSLQHQVISVFFVIF